MWVKRRVNVDEGGGGKESERGGKRERKKKKKKSDRLDANEMPNEFSRVTSGVGLTRRALL